VPFLLPLCLGALRPSSLHSHTGALSDSSLRFLASEDVLMRTGHVTLSIVLVRVPLRLRPSRRTRSALRLPDLNFVGRWSFYSAARPVFELYSATFVP